MPLHDEQVPETQPAAPNSPDRTRTAAPELDAGDPADRTRTSAPDHRACDPADSTRAAASRDRDRYRILGEHGRGGLGRVSRAHDLDLGRDVAIKELISRGPMNEVRFLREALITARLEHPGIVPVHEAGRWPDGTPFYAMKLVAGRPLRDLIQESKTVEQRIGLLHHVIVVADAIAYAHGRNIIHRDLKPANVIVGDFGETVVIDWGLAKDLTAPEDSIRSGGSSPSVHDDGLTSTGSVLGTPAYMSPEQGRGEPVDQRTDVFAIGVMLWELCTLQKLPPSDSGQRQRMLRRTGIDQDLATIVTKATDPSLDLRYADASALAADLKAFKAGARISGRHYSLWALLAHWRRRHARLATAIAGALTITFAAILVYVHNIAVERDRADRSELEVTRAKATSDSSLHELTLKHTELLLRSDPTAANSLLDTYRGSDTIRYTQLRAEAHGLGIARRVLHPHFDTVYFAVGQSDGSVVSISEDARVRRTSEKEVSTLSSDVSHTGVFAYSVAKHLLAYATPQQHVAILNTDTRSKLLVTARSPISLAFSEDGSTIATLSSDGAVEVWPTASAVSLASYHELFPGAQRIVFAAQGGLLILEKSRLRLVAPDGRRMAVLPVESSALDSFVGSDSSNLIAVGTDHGELQLVAARLQPLASIKACKSSVTAVRFIPNRSLLAFGCEDGTVGLVDVQPNTKLLAILDTFKTSARISDLTADEAGTCILASSGNDVYLHDVESRLTTRLYGHAVRISAIAAPTQKFRYLLTGDVHGSLRIWDIPPAPARVLAHLQGTPSGAEFSPIDDTLAVYGNEPTIQIVRLSDGDVRQLRGHTGAIRGLRYSSGGDRLLSYGWDGTARIWQASSGVTTRVLVGHGSLVQTGYFVTADEQAVTAGDDGHVFLWNSSSGNGVAIFTDTMPVVGLQIIAGKNSFLAQDSSGALWELNFHGQVSPVGNAHNSEVTITRVSHDGRLAAVGQDSGTVTLYRTSDWRISGTFTTQSSIGDIVWDPRGASLAVLSEDDSVSIIDITQQGSPASWPTVRANVHNIAYSADGSLIAMSTSEGGTWFYSTRRKSWSYVHDHHTEIRWGGFSPTRTMFVSIDAEGRVIARDLRELFAPGVSTPLPHNRDDQ